MGPGPEGSESWGGGDMLKSDGRDGATGCVDKMGTGDDLMG